MSSAKDESMQGIMEAAKTVSETELSDAELLDVTGGSGYNENTLGSTESDAFRRAKQQLAKAESVKAEADAITNQIMALKSLSPQEYEARSDEAYRLMLRLQECSSIYNAYLTGANI